MDKGKPSFSLSIIKEYVRNGKIAFTSTAILTANALGFTIQDMKKEILRLEASEFYKSMTTYKDHHNWQDVYHHKSENAYLYIKLIVANEVLIISFKEI